MFTVPTIVANDDLTKRSYVTFYFNNIRVREYNGKNVALRLTPNTAKTISERNKLLELLRFEMHKALDAKLYPIKILPNLSTPVLPTALTLAEDRISTSSKAITVLFLTVRAKLRSSLSKKYKRNLKSIYRQLRKFMTSDESSGSLLSIKPARLEAFLSQFGSTGTYYMNKRRDLGVLFSAAGRQINHTIETVKVTTKRKAKATLHQKYEKEQLKPILSYLKQHYPKLYICCLLTYCSWLRPHEEIRLLTKGSFINDLSEIHLSGDENKGGRVRVVYIPEYARRDLLPILAQLNLNDNIFSQKLKPFNEYYFNTQWTRAWFKMYELGLVFDNQTIYSFRHTAAVATYKKTKDVYLLQKLLDHSTILVTLKYLRSLGEFNSEELRDAAPTL